MRPNPVFVEDHEPQLDHDPQPWDRLVSGLCLAVDCVASLPLHASCSSENDGTSPIVMYEQVLNLLLLDSRPGMPLIHSLHSLDGAIHVLSDLHGILPTTQIALALQSSFICLLRRGFMICSLHPADPLILNLEKRTWTILMRSFESCGIFLSSVSSHSEVNNVSQVAWVAAGRAILQCFEFWRSEIAVYHWKPSVDAPDFCMIADLCLECFSVPANVCSNDCISVAMDLLASVLSVCPCWHDRVSKEMGVFRRFASLLSGSTLRATASVKSSALRLIGSCFEEGLQPQDLDDDLLKSRPNAPELRFSPAGHAFGGGPLLSICGVDLAAVDTVIKSLHAPASSKLVPWLVAPLSPIVAVSQICRSAMMFGQGLKLKQLMPNFRTGLLEKSPLDSNDGVQLLKHLVDCKGFEKQDQIPGQINLVSLSSQIVVSYLPRIEPPTGFTCHENSASIECSFWLHLLTTALVHLKGMLTLFISFSMNKELSLIDALPIFNPKPQATLFPHFASALDHPVVAPVVVLRNMPVTEPKKSSHFVSNPLCVPLFVTLNPNLAATSADAAAARIEPNSEFLVLLNHLENNLEARIDVSAFDSFLSILQVLLNDRLKLIQELLSEYNRIGDPYSKLFRDMMNPTTDTDKQSRERERKNYTPLFDASGMQTAGADQFLRLLVRFHMERSLFLTDMFRLGLINGSDDTSDDTVKQSPKTISFVVRVAASLAAIPARQVSEIILRELELPPLVDNFWPVVVALFFPCNASKFSAVHKVVNHCADFFSGLCIELTGLSYKLASIFLDEHPSFPISHVLSRLDVMPSAWCRQNFRALYFPRCFLDHFSRFLSASGFFSDPGSMQVKKERDKAMQIFLSFFSVQTKASCLSGIPPVLLQHLALDESIIQFLCVQNFRPHLRKDSTFSTAAVQCSFEDMARSHPFPEEKCSFDVQWYVYLKKLLFRQNFQNTSLVTSLYMLDFIRSFYSATFRRSKFLSMGFSFFYPDHARIALDIYHEYEHQHEFIQTIVKIINSMGCVSSNLEIAKSSMLAVEQEHAFVKKCFEFICYVVEDNFVAECVDPAALRPLQLDMSVAKSHLQDMEFNALKKQSSWETSCFTSSKRLSPNPLAIERIILSSSSSRMPVVRMESVSFQNLKSGPDPKWKKDDLCFAKYEDKFYPAQVDSIDSKQVQVSFTEYELDKQRAQHKCAIDDLKAFVGHAEVIFDMKMKWKREIPVASVVKVFNDKAECKLWNQERNPFLQVMKKEPGGILENLFIFDNQDLLLLKAAFREDFRISGASDESINGVYELSSFDGTAEYSKYIMNPTLFGPQGSHYRSFSAYSKPQKPGCLDLPELSYAPSQGWRILLGGKEVASLRTTNPVGLKHCLSCSNWKEKGFSSNIRLELLTNTSSPSVSIIRRSCLIRLIHKTGCIDRFKGLHGNWKMSANLVFESLCLYSKSPFFSVSRDSTLPSFLGCFCAMISLLPRDRASMYSPPIRGICLTLTQYLCGADPDDPNTVLTSFQLSAIGVILSTFSLASG